MVQQSLSYFLYPSLKDHQSCDLAFLSPGNAEISGVISEQLFACIRAHGTTVKLFLNTLCFHKIGKALAIYIPCSILGEGEFIGHTSSSRLLDYL